MDILNDTIAAVSTPRGTGGIAVVRISGERSFEIADAMLRLKKRVRLADTEHGKLQLCTVVSENGVIDECMCTHFKAPHSYTGEDSVEIFCHGGALCTSLVLEQCFTAGARQALAGEFTKRAYINGKLSLSAAEAVGELIHAKTEAAVRISNSNIQGTLEREINTISDKLRELLASVYVYIDYPDEELYDVSASEMREALIEIKKKVDVLASSYRSGMAVSEGIETAIVGAPNTGKSTLLNLLCGKERAIVTDIAGTTRDVISEEVVLGDLLLRLSDTAGVRDTDDKVESIGISKSYGEIDSAQLVIAVFDGSRPLSSDDEKLIDYLLAKEKTVVAVMNKTDLGAIPEKRLRERFGELCTISALDRASKDELCRRISALYLDDAIDFSQTPVVTTAQRHSALVNASRSIGEAAALLEKSDEQTLAGSLCEDAISYLCESSGKSVSEDIVNTIFSKFCVGK